MCGREIMTVKERDAMSPPRKSPTVGTNLEPNELEAWNAFCAKHSGYKKNQLIRMALARYVRENQMPWPNLGSLEFVPCPIPVLPDPTNDKPTPTKKK